MYRHVQLDSLSNEELRIMINHVIYLETVIDSADKIEEEIYLPLGMALDSKLGFKQGKAELILSGHGILDNSNGYLKELIAVGIFKEAYDTSTSSDYKEQRTLMVSETGIKYLKDALAIIASKN